MKVRSYGRQGNLLFVCIKYALLCIRGIQRVLASLDMVFGEVSEVKSVAWVVGWVRVGLPSFLHYSVNSDISLVMINQYNQS